MTDKLKNFFVKCEKNPPISEELATSLLKKYPQNYVNFLKFSNGLEGSAENGSYLQLWKAEELGELNKEHQVEEFVPGMSLIGSNGGDEAIGIDLRQNSQTRGFFYKVPFIPLSWKGAVLQGSEIVDIKTV